MNETSARRLPSRYASATALVAVAMALLLTSRANAQSPPPYHYDTTHCENSYYFVLTTADRARAEVPARFSILGEEVGLAVVGVLFTTCDIALNGGSFERASWSDVGVLIVPPTGLLDGSVTIHAYRSWNVSNLRAMVALNEQWGIATGPADVDTVYAPGGVIATTIGFVESAYGRYGGQGYFEPVVHPGAPGVVSWWSDGSAGLVRFDQAYTNDTEQCGIGAVTGEGRFGALVGGSGIGFHGCVVFADLIGDAVLVEPAS